jgi:hypothetical protein
MTKAVKFVAFGVAAFITGWVVGAIAFVMLAARWLR